jgi:amidase
MPDFREVIPGTRASAGHTSVAELQAAMAAGELTSAELTSFYLQRIDRLNPALHAVITVNLNAPAEAAASDAIRNDRGARGPLEGVPVLVKDNVQVAGMPTTAGSPALLSAEPEDAFLITRLRAAGAVIIGKANLSEWANFRSTHSTSGWSTLGGQTANPYALDRNPSGSSSGSAAGVAAALAPVAVGTETDGSIVCPASACGIVGLKPTNGLVSRRGIVPISPVQDTAGPMATCVADAAALLAALAAADPEDPVAPGDDILAERAIAILGPSSFTQALDVAALDGARLGIWRAPSVPAGAATGAVLDMAVAKLRALGAVVTDPVTLPGVAQIPEPEFTALRYEFKWGINAYLGYVAGFGFGGALPRTLAELIDFNKRNADLVLSRFGQETFAASEATSGDLTDPEYLAARREATRLARTAISAPLAEHGVEAIVALTANPASLTDYVLGDHDVFHTSGPAAVAGCPSITVPAGYVSGLPVGVSFFGPRWSEPRLIALAYAFEQATGVRQLPSLAPSLVLAGDFPR